MIIALNPTLLFVVCKNYFSSLKKYENDFSLAHSLKFCLKLNNSIRDIIQTFEKARFFIVCVFLN